MFVSDDIRYIGVNDHQVDLFEGQYAVPNGMCYNSYVILDDKIAVMDTADQYFTEQWLANLREALNGRTPSYLAFYSGFYNLPHFPVLHNTHPYCTLPRLHRHRNKQISRMPNLWIL